MWRICLYLACLTATACSGNKTNKPPPDNSNPLRFAEDFENLSGAAHVGYPDLPEALFSLDRWTNIQRAPDVPPNDMGVVNEAGSNVGYFIAQAGSGSQSKMDLVKQTGVSAQVGETWRFTAGSRIGIHAAYVVINGNGQLHYSGKAGFMEATVAPGEYIDLSLPVPATTSAGRYVTFVDLSERNVSFTQYGSEPLTHDWEARDASPDRGR